MASIGEWIREGRNARGWSQLRLGRELGVTTTRISNWERGVQEPEEEHRKLLRQVLGREDGSPPAVESAESADGIARRRLGAWIKEQRTALGWNQAIVAVHPPSSTAALSR